MAPFRQLPAMVGLAVVSLLTAAATLVVFKVTSDQRSIGDVKRSMMASLLEMRLFKDDLPAVFRAQRQLLMSNARYLWLSLRPMLWLLVPIGLLVVHLECRYAYTGFRPGESVLVTAHLRHPVASVALDAPTGIHVLSPAVWFPATNEVIWRIQPEAPGEYELNVVTDGEAFTKTLDVTDRIVRRSTARVGAGFMAELMNPSEHPLPARAVVTAITVAYPPREMHLFGRELSWMTVYFGLTFAFAIVLRRPLNVTV